ncbi:hypothetical protein KY290_012628 [Solanum tuberosum]|uniref:Uncharacterized protein n=2 Tax=Solanum tuberosum TaxID=4113 RepID=A0ABQ7VMH4_SOLTU|nr:hypothetical protein KY290_012628 [Solanum tuberosum]
MQSKGDAGRPRLTVVGSPRQTRALRAQRRPTFVCSPRAMRPRPTRPRPRACKPRPTSAVRCRASHARRRLSEGGDAGRPRPTSAERCVQAKGDAGRPRPTSTERCVQAMGDAV